MASVLVCEFEEDEEEMNEHFAGSLNDTETQFRMEQSGPLH